jgi:alpha-L-rhamnosidase
MRKSTVLARLLSSTLMAGLCLSPAMAGTPDDSLQSGFSNPPPAARPRVWWYWLNSNITQTGIRKDLEWMSRIGVGGALNFEGSLFTPQIVPPVAYMTPEWKEDFRYTAETAHRLGLEFGIAGSPGFSESGGPWVPPQDGMKKLVWSETAVEGGLPFHERLPHPPTVTGAYQTAAYNPGLDQSRVSQISRCRAPMGIPQ